MGAAALHVLFLCKSVTRRKHLCEESRTLGRGAILSSPQLAGANMALALCELPRNAGEDNGGVWRLLPLKQTKKNRVRENEKKNRRAFKAKNYLCFIFKLTSGAAIEYPALKFTYQTPLSQASALPL